VIPRGLLRAKVLESFDGVEWRPAVKHLGLSAETSSEALSPLEIFREPLATEVLPAPYGTAGVETEGEPRERYESGEFAYPGSQAKRVAYRLLRGSGYGLPKADLPRDVHLRKPSPARFPRLRVLARELAQGANTAAEKVNRVTQYLATGFRAEQAAVGSAEEATHPVERFLFETKAGHCELFSTAAALLLREMGVPTRLVAGFRVPLPEEGRVLTVRASHAHAWVEVYTKTGGWQPVDPTPRTLSLSSMPTFLTDAYDELNAYWHRYILGYEFDPAMLKAKAKEAIPRFAEAAGALLLILFAMACRKLWRWLRRPRVPRAEVARAFAKAPRSSSPEFELLQARYEELRFGALEPTPAVVKEFRRAVKAYRRRGA